MANDERDHAGVAGPPPLIIFGPLLLGLALHRFWPIRLLPRAIAMPLGRVLLTGGIGGMLWSFLTFKREGTPIDPQEPVNHIITSGPFRYTRNPSYLSLFTIYLGVTTLVNTLWPVLLLPAAVVAIARGVIEREERYLEEKFGDEYRHYKERVARWI